MNVPAPITSIAAIARIASHLVELICSPYCLFVFGPNISFAVTEKKAIF